MTLDADALVDRRRLRRRVFVWRTLAILLILGLVGFAIVASLDPAVLSGRGAPHVARLSIGGTIVDDRKLQRLIRDMARSDAVKGVILAVDSPGGTTSGSEGLFAAERELAAKKPVVAYVGTLAASGGYIAALGADQIVARRTAIVGSIGVLAPYADVSRLLDTLGVTVGAERSGPLKAQPDGVSPPSPEAKAMLAGIVADSYDWFLGLVMERRGMDEATARPLADGRIYTGHQALENGLIDAIGEEQVAVDWLVHERGVAGGLPIVQWTVPEDGGFAGMFESLSGSFWRGFMHAAGLSETLEQRRLDGLLSLWQGFASAPGGQPGDPAQ